MAEKELKPPKKTKLNKQGIFKTFIGAIPAAMKKFKEGAKKYKEKEKAFVQQEKGKFTKLQQQAKKTYEDLSPNQKKIFDRLGKTNPGMSTGKKIAIAAGLAAGTATLGGGVKFVSDVKEQMEKNRMAGGGVVKKRAKTKTKVSRGTGAAIRGKKFKGVF
jgi:hypothetical protein|tara:strand:+ start:87 stop:566 length:480 start_codon:yes stop_codon:yes gene_type:complete